VRLILGSGSPRRRTILEEIFGSVEVIIPCIDETVLFPETALDYAGRITNLKMDEVLSQLNIQGQYCVITSDTIVLIEDRILGKPSSEEEACTMIGMLSGKEHFVITGLSVFFNNGLQIKRVYDYETTSVRFKKLDNDTIKKYLTLVNCLDKAGSYAVQEHGDILVSSINGSITNVIGFPLRLFFRMIRNIRADEFFSA
jgi:septum formation protein